MLNPAADQRVVITGLGCVSALGEGINSFWDGLSTGRSAASRLAPDIHPDLSIRVAYRIGDFQPERHFDAKQLMVLDRFSQFALVAAREAVADAGLTFDEGLGAQSAVVFGTGIGGKTTDDEAAERLYRGGHMRVNPMIIPRVMPSAASSQISTEFGITGPTFTTTSACASAGHAIGQAYMMIRCGMTPLALTGGAEACLNYGTMKAWEAMRVMAPDTCRPFSRGRKGMVLGEGGAVLVLESLEHARRRGARIYAELAGFGMSADAGHITRPSAAGAARAMRAALADARTPAERVDYVNAHGTGTAINDVTETRALHEVFAGHAPRLVVSSSKSMHGHALGAGPAIELAATVLALHHGIVPPTANFLEPDPECDLDYVPNAARELTVDTALSNSFAFGGLNAVLLIRRYAD